MKQMKNVTRRNGTWILCWLACVMGAAAAQADWLVTRAGERIETEGGWQVKGRMVVFTQLGGTLSSIRLSEVDLDASREATAGAAEAAARPSEPAPAPAAPRKATRVITTDDVGAGTPGAEGTDLLVERLRQAHRFQDVDLAMGLVNWEDAPEGVRNYFQTQFEWMMERRIRSIQFVEATPEELEAAAQALIDDVAYEPNVQVAGTLEVDFVPDPDQSELGLSFQVGTRLGVYFIAAPREISD